MDFKDIKNERHYLYKDYDEMLVFRSKVDVRPWREGEEGDWVYTDDNHVCQILKKSKLTTSTGRKQTYVRTVCGSFIVLKTVKMHGEEGIAENIYSFSRKNKLVSDTLSPNEKMFARYFVESKDAVSSFKAAFPKAKNEQYIHKKANALLKSEKIDTMVKKGTKSALEKNDVSAEWLISEYKDIILSSEKTSDKLSSLRDLSKIAGLFDTEDTKREELTVWSPSPQQLEALNKNGEAKLLAHAEEEGKDS